MASKGSTEHVVRSDLTGLPLSRVRVVRLGDITQGHTAGKVHDKSATYILLTKSF